MSAPLCTSSAPSQKIEPGQSPATTTTMPVIFFDTANHQDLTTQFKPSNEKNLRLMLWAGDGKHDGVTDVRRLPGYDIYLCAGWQQSFQDNIDDLTDRQTLCVLDIHCEKQLALFHYMYDGCFAHIDSDYNGNTPSLPLTDYTSLLQPGGTAYNIEGINGLIMPEENLYGMLELFAPALPYEFQNKRKWCWPVLELSERDDLDPAMVWTSPDLNHPYYAYVKERQKDFEDQQRRRSAAWPRCEDTLLAQWMKADTKLLLTSLRQHLPTAHAAFDAVLPHLSRFDEFLGNKIDEMLSIKPRCTLIRPDYENEQKQFCDNILSTVSFKQTVLKLLGINLPDGLRATIGGYKDGRYRDMRWRYGLRLKKEGPHQ